MNVYCIVMFEFNYSVGYIRNSDLGEGIICLGEGSGGVRGEGSGGKGGGKWGKWGGKWGLGGREVGKAYPPPPVHPLLYQPNIFKNLSFSQKLYYRNDYDLFPWILSMCKLRRIIHNLNDARML